MLPSLFRRPKGEWRGRIQFANIAIGRYHLKSRNILRLQPVVSMWAATALPLAQVDDPPPWPDANRRLISGAGAWIDPLKRLSTFDDGEFENFVLQWINGYLKGQYNDVQRRGAAGDKGRDIVAWIDPPGTPNRRWDLYQCKHYKDPLAPSDFRVELGKLGFYVERGDYTLPEKYVILTHKGVGNALQDLIDTPANLVRSLKDNWATQCESKITRGAKVTLTGKLLDFVNKVDLSIVHTVSPYDLIEQHSHTKYHSYVFGTKLMVRPPVPPPPKEVHAKETRYVDAMYGAFAEHLNVPTCTLASISGHKHLRSTFDHARVCFYSAESLKEFSRETWPDDSCFNAVADIIHQGIQFTMTDNHADGYRRMRAACETALTVQVDAALPLGDPPPNDRIGVCHQLANDGLVTWKVKDE